MNATRWAALVMASLVILAAGAYAILWLVSAGRMEDAARAWLAEQRAAGWTAEAEGLSVGGFPALITLEVRGLALAPPAQSVAVPWHWRTDRAVVRAEAWAPRSPTVDLAGTHAVSLPAAGREVLTHEVTAEAADIGLRLDRGGQVVGFSVEVTALTAKPKGQADAVRLASLSAAVLPEAASSEFLDLREASYLARLNARGLSIPAALSPPLGPDADSLDIEARILGPFRLEPGTPFRGSVRTWRDAGGTIQVDRFRLGWPPLTLSAAGTLALDQSLQPVATLSARLQGFFQAVTRLEQVGVVRAREASVARVILGVMAQRDPAGGAPILTVPLTIQDRILRVGPVAVYHLPPIRWGGHDVAPAEEIKPGFDIDRSGAVIRRD